MIEIPVGLQIQSLIADIAQIKEQMTALQTSGTKSGDAITQTFQKSTTAIQANTVAVSKEQTEIIELEKLLSDVRTEYDRMAVSKKKATNPDDASRLSKKMQEAKHDIKQYEAELKKVQTATNNAFKQKPIVDHNSAIAQTKEKYKGLGRVLNDLKSQIVSAFAVQAVISFAKESVKAFVDTEKQARLLNFAMDGNKKSIESLNAQAQQLKSTGLWDDDDITRGQVFLAQQGRTEEQIKKTIDAATKLSLLTGDDLQTSVEKLDMTYEGSLGRLSKYDSRLKDLTQTELENGAAVDIINEKYKELVNETAQTAEAKLGRLAIMWQDVKEAVGGAVVAIMDVNDVEAELTEHLTMQAVKTGLSTQQQKELNKAFEDGRISADEYKKIISATSMETQIFTDINKTAVETLQSLNQKPEFEFYKNIINAAKDMKSQINEISKSLPTPYERLVEQISKLEASLKNEIFIGASSVSMTQAQIVEKKKLVAVIDEQIRIMNELGDAMQEVGRISSGVTRESMESFGSIGEAGAGAESGGEGFGLLKQLGIDKDSISKMKEIFGEVSGFFSDIAKERADFYADLVSKQTSLLSELQRELDTELKLHEQGFASNVAVKEEEYDKLKKMREESLRDQERALNTQRTMEGIQQSISLTTAVASILKDAAVKSGILAPIIGGIAVASLLGVFMMNRQRAKASTQTYRHGGYGVLSGASHEAGGIPIPIGEAEGGEGMAIFSREATRKNKLLPELVKAINSGDKNIMSDVFGRFAPGSFDVTPLTKALQDRELNIHTSISLTKVPQFNEMVELLKKQGMNATFVNEKGQRIIKTGSRTTIYN